MRNKLPTAEESLKKFCGENILNSGFYAGPKFALQAIESHTQAHTKELRERLGAENQRLREALEKISTPIHGEYPDIETVNWIAKEALKQEVNND